SDATRGLEEVRERSRRAELEEAEARMRLEAAVETLRREQDCEPETAMAAECPELPAGTSPPNRVRELERERRLMGPINPLARPVGKNVRKLSLLSGGERSLTALAFLFAVFRSRPSPFYLMDEVEAALDDVNLHRFLELVHEFRDEAQLLVVTHQKRTMEAADCLYGVTMQPGGSSRVISERVTVVA